MPSPLRIGIIGLKNQGREHLLAAPFLKHARIVAVCDTNPKELDSVRKTFPEILCHHSIESIASDNSVDALILALPHHIYPTVWETIIGSGKPLLKEKPLGRTLNEGFFFVQSAKKHNTYLQTAIQRRTHPSYLFLRDYLKNEPPPSSINLTMHLGFDPDRDGSGWRGNATHAGGGVILDYGYHGIDLLFFLLGKLELVSATLWRGDRPATANCLESEAMLVLRSGSTWIHLDLRVGGEPDTSRKSGFKKQESITIDLPKGTLRADRTSVSINGDPLFTCNKDWTHAMTSQLDGFAKNIQSASLDHDHVWEQIPAMRLIERIYTEAGFTWPLETNLSSHPSKKP